MQKRVLLLTGSPGVGKTTVLMKTVEILRQRGFTVGGMISQEVREGGVRVGFEILDLATSKRGWLAHMNQRSGQRVGKYGVNISDLERVGATAIRAAVRDCDLVAIDEIGPMELFSTEFREAVKEALNSQKTVIAVVHWKAQDKLVNEAKQRKDAEIVTVTTENRQQLDRITAEKAIENVEKT